jgi:hypothetical protein
MSSANTSFEHVLHNLQERDRIVTEAHAATIQLLEHLNQRQHQLNQLYRVSDAMARTLDTLVARVESLFAEYKQTIDRFNIGIISFISEYYSIADQHSDQFSSRSLHTYSGHRGHYNPILSPSSSSNQPSSPTFDIQELVNIFQEHCYDFKHFKSHSDPNLRRSRERTWAIYQNLASYIASENVYDLAELVMREVSSIVVGFSAIVPARTAGASAVIARAKLPPKQRKSDAGAKLELGDDDVRLFFSLHSMLQEFNNIKLDLKPTEEELDLCECGHPMQALAGSSEMICTRCGYLYELKGTVFSDEQFYCQDGTRYKHAGYEPSKHCKCWLERIQARETNTITPEQIGKIEACMLRDGITNKKRLSIEQLRRYLKDSGLTELNEHVALIKRLITGITPPQLSYAETQDITSSFSKAVKAYNIIRPSNKSNMVFYPYVLAKLIEQHVMNYNKRRSLLSFIHLQGPQTLIQNDQIWQQICDATPGLVYRPTDRYEYLD